MNNLDSMPTLTTPRLILKSFTVDQLETVHRWLNDPELAYYDDDEPPTETSSTLEETKTTLARWINRPLSSGIIDLAIHKQENDQAIGFCQIAHIDTYNQRCDLGIVIGHKPDWGNGYANEAVQALIRYCFVELKLNRIGAEIYEFNHRSLKLFKKLGFQQEGTKRQYVFKDNQFKDELVFSLLRGDWQE
ncbi:MAG: hypothetical protein CL609_13180 [Anaerolineaceae bacterium]|nr:hypothetical protein [Anaerolineaceae bacterium]